MLILKKQKNQKYLPGQIVKMMHDEGFPNFRVHYHILLWKKENAKDPAKGYGTLVAGKIGTGTNVGLTWFGNIVGIIKRFTHNDRISKNKRISY